MDQLDAMRVFVAVATLGSFAGAGRRLRLSPSVVTRAIAQLEDRLAETVLSRTTRSVRLTERGATYLASCRQILDDVEAAERRVRGENAAPRGELAIAAPVVFGRLHVLPIVTRLLAAHRGLTIRLTLSDRYAHLVDEGVDAAVRIGQLADSSLIAVRLGAVSRVVVASPRYLAARGTPRTPAELAAHDVIGFEYTDYSSEWRFAGGASPGASPGATDEAVRLEPRLLVNSADAAIAAAEDGLGITRTLSYQVHAAVEAGRLVPILGDHAPPAVPVHVVYPARRIASVNVTAFVDAARAYIQAAPLVAVDAWRVPGCATAARARARRASGDP
ncbi:MAG TPA: LysR family transcriptional regulator [Kofleriaceae bacterium]|jgi:DNA-binding transcriptional LysR family regulator|nr:LysR family transcriptional regulator [Kofleriaceae bacterium]